MCRQQPLRHQLIGLCYKLGLFLMVASLLIPLFYQGEVFGYLLLVGSLLYTTSQAFVNSSADLRTKRLRGMAILGGVLFVAGSYLFIVHTSYWQLILLIASVLILYSNVVLLYHLDHSTGANTVE